MSTGVVWTYTGSEFAADLATQEGPAKPKESPEAALHRLANEAQRKGICVYQYELTGEFYATSHSQPDRLHRVTLWSCDCQGFQRHQRCAHLAALLHHIGELPPDPPTPPAAALPVRTTHPTFDAIEAVLTGQEGAELAFALEVNLRQPSPACDELPTHEELLVACGLTCTPDEYLAWCDWQNERQEIIDRMGMAVAA